MAKDYLLSSAEKRQARQARRARVAERQRRAEALHEQTKALCAQLVDYTAQRAACAQLLQASGCFGEAAAAIASSVAALEVVCDSHRAHLGASRVSQSSRAGWWWWWWCSCRGVLQTLPCAALRLAHCT
jgi:hypothetical protein